MTILVGVSLGTGLMLVVFSFVWPARPPRADRRQPVLGTARDRLAQAGLGRVGIPTVVVVSILLAVAAGCLALAFVPITAVAVSVAALGLVFPTVVISWRARAARRATRAVWPDVVDHLVSAVRSGVALPDGVAALADVGPSTTRVAFAEFEREYRASGNFAASLDRLKAALADPVADRIIETLRMSREVGGSELTTVLRDLAAYLRRDGAIRSELEARQSWVVNAARLGVAAPWVVLLLLSTRPEAAAAYNTPEGWALITVGLVLSVIAYRAMIAIGRLPDEQRWFA